MSLLEKANIFGNLVRRGVVPGKTSIGRIDGLNENEGGDANGRKQEHGDNLTVGVPIPAMVAGQERKVCVISFFYSLAEFVKIFSPDLVKYPSPIYI